MRVSFGDDAGVFSTCSDAVVGVEVSIVCDMVIDVDDASAIVLVGVSFVSLTRLACSSTWVALGDINPGRADVDDNIIRKEHTEWPKRSLITSETSTPMEIIYSELC